MRCCDDLMSYCIVHMKDKGNLGGQAGREGGREGRELNVRKRYEQHYYCYCCFIETTVNEKNTNKNSSN